MNKLSRSGLMLMLLALLAACGKPSQRLDEYVFYDGPQLSLKLVRFYRNIPFNYLGEHAIVMCRSAQTVDLSAADPQDAGWRPLGETEAAGSKSAKEVASKVKGDYRVLREHILIASNSILNISFDACGHFIHWDPSRLPKTMIVALESPADCMPHGPRDCRYHNFKGERAPRYEAFETAGAGQVSFQVSSAAFRDVTSLRVETRNNGAVWHVDRRGPATDAPRLKPEILRALPVRMLEKAAEDVSLQNWLDSALPSGSMVIWPDRAGHCAEGAGSEGRFVDQRCVRIRLENEAGSRGMLDIAVSGVSGKGPLTANIHSAVYIAADRSRRFGSLAELVALLSSQAR